nr:MAG TPA: tail connector protein [Caudoviricetes sp.]
MTLEQAKNILRVDGGDNDALVSSLLYALPDYIEVATGMDYNQQATEPLVDTVSGFLLTLWYYGDHSDADKLQRVIDSLLKAITLKVARSK